MILFVFFGKRKLAKKVLVKMLVKLTPDCNATIYKTQVTAVPLRNCRFANLGNSQLCHGKQNPLGMYNALIEEYTSRFPLIPFFMKMYSSSIRKKGRFNVK